MLMAMARHRGTEFSNSFPSSGESANSRSQLDPDLESGNASRSRLGLAAWRSYFSSGNQASTASRAVPSLA
jgi:hypothetical protein